MSWSSPFFVLAIIAISTIGVTVGNWIRAKHGYPVEDQCGGIQHRSEGPDAARKFELLSSENERLKQQIIRLEERVAVLERIATDTGTRLAKEIEALR